MALGCRTLRLASQSSAGLRMQPYPRSPDLIWPGHLHGTGCLSARAVGTGFPTVGLRLSLGPGFGWSWVLVTPARRGWGLGWVCLGSVCRVVPLLPAVCGVRGWALVSACFRDVCGFVRVSLAPRRFRFRCAVWACVLGPGLGCAPPFLARLSGCVFCAFFFFSGCWVSLSRASWSLPPSAFFRAGLLAFFFCVCVSACFGAPFPGGPLFLAWCCRFGLGGPPVPVWESCLRCPLGGGFGHLLCCWRAVWWLGLFSRAPPPFFFFFSFFFFGGGAGRPGCSALRLPPAGACSVADVWCGWSLATPGRGSCVLLPATPGLASLPLVVGGPRHSWLGSAGGGGVWCVVCGGGVLVGLWLVCGVVGPSPLLAEVRVCYSPPLLAGFRCRWWWAAPATPGWGPLAALLYGVWCVAVVCWWGCGWCVVWLVPRHSLRRFLCATPRNSWLGFAAAGGGRSPPLPAGVRGALLCGVWCVAVVLLVGLWLVCGVVGPSPLLAEVPVCYSPPLLAGFRCQWWWAVPATPGWGPLAAVVCGVCCVVCGVWRWCAGGVLAGVWCGWSLATPGGGSCVLPPATPGWVSLPVVVGGPRHSWLGSAGGGGVWCVVCGVWRWCVVGVVVGVWCGWSLATPGGGPCVLLPATPGWVSLPVVVGGPRHSWLGSACGGGVWCVVCGVWRWCVGRVVAGVWCGWSLATPGGGSCVLLPATPGWVSLPVVVGGPRHSWLGSAGGGGVWCVVCGVWRWCVVGVVVGVWCGWSLATPGGGPCVLLPATPGWVSLPSVVGGPRHSWLGSVGGGGVWCVVCGVWCVGGVPRHSWRRFL